MLGETQQVGYAEDRNKIIQELYDKAGGFEGTGKHFQNLWQMFYLKVIIQQKAAEQVMKVVVMYHYQLGRWNDISDAFEKYQEDNKNTIGPLMGFKEFLITTLITQLVVGRVGLAEGDTPSQAWMRDYFYDAGYDDQGVITLDEYMNGPIGWKDYMEHGPGKYAKGGRAGYLKGGLLRTGIMEALDFLLEKVVDKVQMLEKLFYLRMMLETTPLIWEK